MTNTKSLFNVDPGVLPIVYSVSVLILFSVDDFPSWLTSSVCCVLTSCSIYSVWMVWSYLLGCTISLLCTLWLTGVAFVGFAILCTSVLTLYRLEFLGIPAREFRLVPSIFPLLPARLHGGNIAEFRWMVRKIKFSWYCYLYKPCWADTTAIGAWLTVEPFIGLEPFSTSLLLFLSMNVEGLCFGPCNQLIVYNLLWYNDLFSNCNGKNNGRNFPDWLLSVMHLSMRTPTLHP